MNEELGRHRGREGKVECTLCGAECESVYALTLSTTQSTFYFIVHVLWECPAYSNYIINVFEKASGAIRILTLIRLII